MKVLLFGATGGTGTELLQQALEKGHAVTAFVRTPSKIKIQSNNLTIVEGDVLTSNMDSVFAGQDVVICCLGAAPNKAGTLRSEGTRNIIKAMERTGVKRLICQSSLGFGDSSSLLNNTSFFFRRIIVPYLLKATFKEHQLQETIIRQSGLNWTIVRPGSLTKGGKTRNYKYGFSYTDPTVKVKISRADVADFMLSQVDSSESSRQTIGISY